MKNEKGEIGEIRVNIPRNYRRFSELDFSMPELPDGARLVVVEEDLGPATKILPAIADLGGTSCKIIYCDDDRIVHRNFGQDLIDAAKNKPECIVANSGCDIELPGMKFEWHSAPNRVRRYNTHFDIPYRVRRLKQKINGILGNYDPAKPKHSWSIRNGYMDIMQGCGGVIIKADQLDREVFNIPTEVWTVDDIWLSGMAALKGTPIYSNNGYIPTEISGAADTALVNQSINGMNRLEANQNCIRYLQRKYGIWSQIDFS
ncbi:MAG: hypothetical protein OXD29_14365 [Roseovarius sp.]|nr:hypothetical protein [Roseovarius sp.]